MLGNNMSDRINDAIGNRLVDMLFSNSALQGNPAAVPAQPAPQLPPQIAVQTRNQHILVPCTGHPKFLSTQVNSNGPKAGDGGFGWETGTTVPPSRMVMGLLGQSYRNPPKRAGWLGIARKAPFVE